MSETKFTPGPWYAIPHLKWQGAKCRIDTKPDARWGNFGEIAYASPNNARLIAAAPELYEARMRDAIDSSCAKWCNGAARNQNRPRRPRKS